MGGPALPRLDLALASQNLLYFDHVERGVGALGGRGTNFVQIRRSVYMRRHGFRW
jgi:hypothetical protein